MLEEVDTGFEFLIPAYKNRGNSSKPGGVESNEIFGIGGEVVLPAATQAKVANLLEEETELLLPQDEAGGSCAAIA
jgi:hypothetical protein